MTSDESRGDTCPDDADNDRPGAEDDGPDFEIVGHTPAEFVAMTEDLLGREWTDEEFDLGDAGVFPLNGMWALSPANWEPEEPVADWAEHPALRWAEEYRDALITAWGSPDTFVPRYDSETGTPHGVIDVIFTSFGLEDALEWTHGDRHFLLAFKWDDGPGSGRFDLLLLIAPEAVYSGGQATIFSQEASIEPHLFHGEELGELLRRAALIAYVGGRGEETVLTPGSDEIGATRCGYRIDQFTWAHWLFTADSRALLLILDTTTKGLLDPGAELDPDAEEEDENEDHEAALAQLRGLYYGIPDDLLDLMSRPASSVEGKVSTVEGFPVNGRILPRISGAFWFDGEDWHNSPGLMEYSNRHDVGFDDVGFDNAVRRPLRLGGDFQPEHLLIPGHVNLADTAEVERALGYFRSAFENSPHPVGTRPEGLIRLGASICRAEADTLLDDIETSVAGWWDAGLAVYERNENPFAMGGRAFDSYGDRELVAHLGLAEEWTADAFSEWMNSLITAATERWGEPFRINAHDPATGRTLRIPSARPLRGNGFESAPAWWVNGLVVSFVHGASPRWDMLPDGWHLPSSRPGPIAMTYIFPADAVIDPVRGTKVDELRYRVRTIAALHGAASQSVDWNSTPIGYRTNDSKKSRNLFAHTTAEAVRWVLPAPRLDSVASEIIDRGYHAWHFTHDNRALLITWSEDSPFNVFAGPRDARTASVTYGGAETAFEKQAALYDGVPEDLLSLVTDLPENTGMHTVTDDEGRTLAAATGVLWYNGLDRIVPTGLLTAVHEYVDAEVDELCSDEDSPITAPKLLMSGPDGLRTATYTVAAGNDFDSEFFQYDRDYTRNVFGRVPQPDEIARALGSYGTVENVVMNGSLKGFLDVRARATDFDRLVPAALSNPDPRARRELFLWLLGSGASAMAQYSRSTNLTILLDNEVLDPASDAVLIDELLDRAAAHMVNAITPRVRGGGHPVMQLADRDLPDEALEPLYRAYFNPDFVDVDRLVLPGDVSAEEYLRAGDFPHDHDRTLMAEYLESCRTERRRMDDARAAEMAAAAAADTAHDQTELGTIAKETDDDN